MHHKQLQAHHMLSQTMHHHDHIQWMLVYLTLYGIAKKSQIKEYEWIDKLFLIIECIFFQKPGARFTNT